MFAYCNNLPVNRIDVTGDVFNTIFGTIIGGIAAVLTRDEHESKQDALIRGLTTGFIAGAALDISIATAGSGAVLIAVGGGFAASFIDSAWEQHNQGKEVNYSKATVDGVIGAGVNGLFGAYGRVESRATGNTVNKVISSIAENTVRSVTSQSGKVVAKKVAKTTVFSAIESSIAGFFSKLFSMVASINLKFR